MYVYICVYICMCACVYMYICINMYEHVDVSVDPSVAAPRVSDVSVSTALHAYVCVYLCIYLYVCTCIHVHMYKYVCVSKCRSRPKCCSPTRVWSFFVHRMYVHVCIYMRIWPAYKYSVALLCTYVYICAHMYTFVYITCVWIYISMYL